MGGVQPADSGTIAERLDWLITTKYPDGLGPSGYEEIARASREYAAAHGGPTISHQSVLNIRSGKVTNPSVNSLQALANVYRVKVTFFLQPVPSAESVPPAASRPMAGASLADRLNELFTATRPRGRSQRTDQDAAEAVSAAGARITADEVRALRTGEWDNPTLRHLHGLADYFGVPCGYFLDDTVAQRVSEDLALLTALKDVGAREVAMRAVAELDDEALTALVPMIELLGKAGRNQRL
jgi:transcriptional regulator with XRE-family HTH domain